MAKNSKSTVALPEEVQLALERLGENLRIARERRSESLRDWAARMAVSVPTLQRMEKGNPAVGMGIYATAAWLAGQLDALAEVAAPSADAQALEMDIAKAKRRRKP